MLPITYTADMLRDVLKKTFGYNSFRPYQEAIIDGILSGRDVVAILPTGSGKSLCYQLPALLQDGVTVVVSPLISLMQDQVLQLTKLGVTAACLTSAQTQMDNQYVMAHFHEHDLIYVSPERLMTPGFLELITHQKIAGFVIDEAHCISQWGHAFRPEYRQLSILRSRFPSIPISAFTATATQDVERDIALQLSMRSPVHIKGSFDRENLLIRVVEKVSAKAQLMAFLDRHKGESGIIYTSTRKKVDDIFTLLSAEDLRVGKYHAGMSDTARQESLESFLYEKTDVIVATIAFGMGINKPNVRFVFHMDMPQTIEHYYQEIGRAGRDGAPAECMMLYSLQDLMLQKRFMDEILDRSARLHMGRKIDQMLSLCNSMACRRVDLLHYFGETFSKSNCGQCDSCLDDVEMMDGTVIAQKVLSCVYRLNQRFGISVVVDVLKGSKTQSISDRGHDRLSTYGLLADHAKQEIRHFVFSLINSGHLLVTEGDYPVVRLTQKARSILFEGASYQFRKKVVVSKKDPKPKKSRLVSSDGQPVDVDYDLFVRLKKCRKEIAEKLGMPPYIVFHDKTLMDMAAQKPQSEAAFLLVNGVGPQKLSRYGEAFLAVILEYCGVR